MVIDLLSPNYPSFENPYPIDLHVSSVTCLYYISDCPGDFVASLYTAKSRTKKSAHSKNQNSMSNHEWPINGGQWGSLLNPRSEMIITGHGDGSVRFWEATGTSLTSLYKFRLSTYLEKMVPCTDSSHIIDCNKSDSTQSTPTLSGNNTGTNTNISTLVDDCGRPCGLEHSLINANVTPLNEDNQVAINHIQLCPESRKLMLAGKYFATMLSFTKRDVISDVPMFFVDSDDDEEDNFINDGSDNESKDFEEKKPQSTSTDVINLVSDSSDAENGPQTPVASGSGSPRTRLRLLELASSGSESSADEVVRSWSTTSQYVTRHNELIELADDEPRIGASCFARQTLVVDSDHSGIEHQIEVSGKLTVLFEILRKASDIGDKIIIFSQSLIVLDIIEKYLEELITIAEHVQRDLEALNDSIDAPVDTEVTGDIPQLPKKPATPLLNDIGYNSWKRGLDYDRMDGSTQALVRADI